jgi:TM2 domain-containing membrane protein YozV
MISIISLLFLFLALSLIKWLDSHAKISFYKSNQIANLLIIIAIIVIAIDRYNAYEGYKERHASEIKIR